MKVNASLDDRDLRNTSARNEPHFNLKAASRRVIGHSEMDSSVFAMEGGIASARKNARDGDKRTDKDGLNTEWSAR